MATQKNFGLVGIGPDVQFGKAGGRLAWTATADVPGQTGHFVAVDAAGAATHVRVPATPNADTAAASKLYVDQRVQGLDAKPSVRAATTGDVALTGTQTIDGVTLLAGDRVLVKNQAAPEENGIYVVAAGAWARAPDMDAFPETPAAFTFVEEGAVNADTGWVSSTDADVAGVIDEDPIAFVQFSAAGQLGAGAGLVRTGNLIDVVGTADRITANADSIDIAATYVGQTSITTLGVVTAGTWNGTTIALANGGTGLSGLGAATAGQVLRIATNGTALEYGTLTGADVDFAPAAGIAATDVQGAIEELAGDIDGRIDALDATMIAFAPGAEMLVGSTTVQAAIMELDDRLDTMAANTAVQDELDLTQTTIGLGADGTLTGGVAFTGTAVGATTVIGAVNQVATALDAINVLGTTDRITVTEGTGGTVGTFTVDLATGFVTRVTTLETEATAAQTAIGLSDAGAFVPFTGTNYLNAATTIVGSLTALDTAVDGVADALATEVTARGTADTALTGRFTALNTALGTTTPDTYTAPTAGPTITIINDATSYMNADMQLDAAITAVAAEVDALVFTAEAITFDNGEAGLDGDPANVQAAIEALDAAIDAMASDTGLQTELDDTQAAIGLDADGNFVAFTGTNYLNAATTIVDSLTALDTALDAVSDTLTAINVVGTAGEVTVAEGTGGAVGTFTVSIDDAYAGQGTITTVGTIGTGTWQGTPVAGGFGGTGLNAAALTAATAGDILRLNGAKTGYEFAPLSAANVSFDNTTADLTGAPATVQAAVDALDTRIDAMGNVFNYVGTVDGSAGMAPGTPTALDGVGPDAGDYFKVAVAGDFDYPNPDYDAGDPESVERIVFFANVNDGIVRNEAGGWDVIDNTNSTVTGTAAEITVDGTPDTGYTVRFADTFRTRMTAAETATTAAQADADAIITSVGLTGGTGALPAFGGVYTTGATSVLDAIDQLDDELELQDGRLDTLESASTAGLGAQFLTLEATTGLANERVFTAGDGLTGTNGGAGLAYTLNVVGTADRIAVTADAVDIAATYVGQESIDTLGTIGTGVWEGTEVGAGFGGTGKNAAALTAAAAGQVLRLNTGKTDWEFADLSAANVSFAPAGTIAATDVQAAIVELEGDVVARTTEIDATQAAAGLGTDGTIGGTGAVAFTGGVAAATTIKGAINTVDAAVTTAQGEVDATQAAAGLGTDGTIGGAGAVAFTGGVAAATTIKGAINTVDAAVTTLQGEVDATQTGAGLGTDGAYTAHVAYHVTNEPNGAEYIDLATSLHNADLLLDREIRLLDGRLDVLESSTGLATLQTEVNAIETSVGLNGDGTKPDFTSVNYVAAGASFFAAVNTLDTALSGLATTVTNLDVDGTADRIVVTENVAGVWVLDIAAGYVGQTSITTLGTVATGTWEGNVVAAEFGGTGQALTEGTAGDILRVNGDGDGYVFAALSAANVSYDNTTADLTGDPVTVQAAVDALDTRIDALGNAFNYVGVLDGTELDLDALDETDAGDYYKVTVAGTYTFAGGTIVANVNDGIVRNTLGGWDRIDNTNSTVTGTAAEITVDGTPDTGYTVRFHNDFRTRMTAAETATTAAQADADAIMTSVGLTAGTGALPAFGGVYTTGATSVLDAIDQLDDELELHDGRLDTLEGASGAGLAAQFLTLAATDGLANERVLTAGAGLTGTDGGAGLGYTLAVGGTADRIAVTADAVDIAATYVGQTSITTLGAVTEGTWNADVVDVVYGGTGLAASTANALLVGGAGNTYTSMAMGAANTVLKVNGAGNALEYALVDAGNVTFTSTEDLVSTDVGAALDELAANLASVDVSRIHDADNNTYVDTNAVAESVTIGTGGDLLATFASAGAASDERFVFTNAVGEIRIEADGTPANVDIRLVPQGTGQVFIGDTGPGTIQADAGESLTVAGGDGDVLILGTTLAPDIEAWAGYTAALLADGSPSDEALVTVGYVADAVADLAGGLVGGAGIAYDDATGTFDADVDGATLTAAGGTGAQLAVRGGTANMTLVSAGGAADATWGYVSSLRDAAGVEAFRAVAGGGTPVNYFEAVNSATGADLNLRAAGTDATIDILLTPKGEGFIFAPAGYAADLVNNVAGVTAETVVTKGYVDSTGAKTLYMEFTEAQAAAVGGFAIGTVRGRVKEVRVGVLTPFDGVLQVGVGGNAALVPGDQIDETTAGIYVSAMNVNYTADTALTIFGGVAGGGAANGTGWVMVEYMAAGIAA